MSTPSNDWNERIQQLFSLTEANTRAIAALEQRQEASLRQIEELRVGINELREGQAMIMQFFVEQREALAEQRLTVAEFQATTSATLVRIDRTLEYLLDRNHNNSPGCLG